MNGGDPYENAAFEVCGAGDLGVVGQAIDFGLFETLDD